MAVVTNRNTTQPGMSTVGRTGNQSVRFIDAPRVYLKAPDSQTAAPVQNYTTKSGGTTPVGFTDLGQVLGRVKVTNTKKMKDIRSGIENVFRAAYTDQKDCMLEFSLAQTDDVVLESLSGLTASIMSAGSTVQYRVGQDNVVQQAILLVQQNIIDGKEWQFYNPCAFMNYDFEQSGDAFAIKVTANFPAFLAAGQTVEQLMSVTINA